jgi:hypothetical protein
MTQDEKQSLIDIQGTPGWRVFTSYCQTIVDDLKDVRNINSDATDFGGQALGKKYATEALVKILDLFNIKTSEKKDNTYE